MISVISKCRLQVVLMASNLHFHKGVFYTQKKLHLIKHSLYIPYPKAHQVLDDIIS
jgi:hypothetical protein